MPVYKYTAMDRSGKTVESVEEAESESALSKLLSKNGLFLMRASQQTARPAAAQGGNVGALGGRVKLADVATFTQQFTLLTKAALPALDAIETLTVNQDSEAFKAALEDIQEKLRRGETLSTAFAAHPNAFDNVYINLLSAGEAGGKVVDMLARISGYLTFQIELRQKIRGALIYPAVVSGAAVTVILFLMLFVLPTFVDIFAQFNAELPAPTRALLWTSTFLTHEWYVVLIGTVGGAYLIRRWAKQPAVMAKLERLELRLPLIGTMVQCVVLTRILRTLAVLIESGVPILHALAFTKAAANHDYYEKLLDRVAAHVSEGRGIASALEEDPRFPSTVASMIHTAERTGNLAEVLKMSAEHYQHELDVTIDSTFSAMEPMFIGFLSLIVAGIAICILQPMMGLSNAVGG
jgi:type II secretory pathway component PulF